MATLTSQQLKDSYQSLVTIGDSITSDPTSGVLENGKGNPITDITIGGDITIADKIIHSGDTNTAIRFPANDTVSIETDGAEAIRIDSTRRFLVGTTTDPTISNNGGVSIAPANNNRAILRLATTGSGELNLLDLINSNGIVGQLKTSSSDVLIDADSNLILETGSTEAMRIDSSGNLLVGKTASNIASVGAELLGVGIISVTRDGDRPLLVNRLTSDGDMLEFRKDGTQIGSIGAISGDVAIYSTSANHNGLRFALNAILPTDNAGLVIDNDADLGSVSYRFDDVYATNGTIQTSDRNEKQDIEELNDAELRVAQKAKTLLRKFRWKSSVEENENARIHFGIIAQDLEQAFADEGLDAGRYAMFIKTTWTNEDGEEQTRLGVRYNQLLAFIISAL